MRVRLFEYSVIEFEEEQCVEGRSVDGSSEVDPLAVLVDDDVALLTRMVCGTNVN